MHTSTIDSPRTPAAMAAGASLSLRQAWLTQKARAAHAGLSFPGLVQCLQTTLAQGERHGCAGRAARAAEARDWAAQLAYRLGYQNVGQAMPAAVVRSDSLRTSWAAGRAQGLSDHRLEFALIDTVRYDSGGMRVSVWRLLMPHGLQVHVRLERDVAQGSRLPRARVQVDLAAARPLLEPHELDGVRADSIRGNERVWEALASDKQRAELVRPVMLARRERPACLDERGTMQVALWSEQHGSFRFDAQVAPCEAAVKLWRQYASMAAAARFYNRLARQTNDSLARNLRVDLHRLLGLNAPA